MVSPSKHQRQQQQYRLPSRENKSNLRASHVRTEKRSKPLEKKSFYLDIKNHAIAAKLETKIKELGGAIELFLVRSVNLVVTDRVDKVIHTNSERHKWGSISGGSGGVRSLRSIEVPTPTPTPPTPFLSSECPLSNSTNPRGQTAQRSKSRVDAMLERALIQPQQCSVDPLDNALNWGIPIWTTDKFQIWLDKIYVSFKDTNDLKHLRQTNQQSATKHLRIKCLKEPYIKFEAYRRNTRPVFLELSAWPTLNFDGDPGSCPFGTKKQGKLENKFISREIKENKEGIESINKEESKEMTRRPRATATRARRTEQVVAGYCEICRSNYDDLSKHVQSEQHLNFVRNDDNFLSLDTLINAGANVEAFLKLNRAKDIEQDCNLFPNGDSNLHNAVLPEDKVTKNSETLSNFSVDEIKMVQCNGVRRNLNLKLSPSHNLRTRAKHESGHLLRSKGSPWHELDKSEKCYDKLEGFTIKKRSKGTIWIEEEDPGDKYVDILKESKEEDYKIKSLSKVIDEVYHAKEDNADSKHNNIDSQNLQQAIIHNSAPNGIVNSRHISENADFFKKKSHEECNGNENADLLECTISENCVVDNSYIENCKSFKEEMFRRGNCTLQSEKVILEARTFPDDTSKIASEIVCNGHNGRTGQKDVKTQSENTRYMKFRYSRTNRRGGGRNVRGRHRLSVEERLIKDNRAYYKVEVLGNKLRSSAMPGCNIQHPVSKDVDSEEKKEVPSSEKPVVVRFKRVRKSELSLLSDEAESFMFGESKRDDSSEASEGEQSSVLPQDTESESNELANSVLLSSSLNYSSPMKQEIIEEDSQDSVHLGRVRKKRRTQAEVFIKDNTDYYKFETPGSRLRYQAPLTGIKDHTEEEHTKGTAELENSKLPSDAVIEADAVIYPSKPSAEIDKMQFSFEAVPKSEPWYQTYQRQDTGAEYWHYFSEGDNMRKPFLLPYEIENFHETMIKNQIRIDGRKRGRGRGAGGMGRSPRKSPRCHASTLAIMSTIIRKKEQFSNLCTIEESPVVDSRTNTPGPDQQQNLKEYIDEDVKEVANTIDDMFDIKGMAELDDLLELDEVQADLDLGSNIPKGAPPNLLELLNNCQDITTCLENSSCASSECGEANPESILKRRKRRKNRTGWPGNKMKKKLPNNKTITDVDCDREILTENRLHSDNRLSKHNTLNASNKSTVAIDSHVTSNNALSVVEQLGVNKKNDVNSLSETYTSNKSSHEGLMKRDKSLECTNETGLSVNTRSNVELSVTEVCNDVDRNYLSNKDYPYRKDLSELEISENEPGNDENHENNLFRKDVNTITERNFISKSPIKKRQRENTASDTCKSHTEIENHEVLCRKDTTEPGIVPRKHHTSNGLSTKQQRRGNPDNPDSELVRRHRSVCKRGGRLASRKRRRRQVKACQPVNNLSSNKVYENENCKKDSYLSITCKKQQSMRNMKRKSEAISADLQESDLERALTERVSPTVVVSSSELEQRRSSIEFQPVVRMMKIDDQVDIDHSILSVTVASNRRLRSSSSPRSNTKPPKKRLKSSRGQFRRWLKSS